jgi:hypothetical protein
MTGDVVADFAHLLAFHGYRRGDMPVYRRAQMALGVKADGLPGPITMNALRRAVAARGIALPELPPWNPSLAQWLAHS